MDRPFEKVRHRRVEIYENSVMLAKAMHVSSRIYEITYIPNSNEESRELHDVGIEEG